MKRRYIALIICIALCCAPLCGAFAQTAAAPCFISVNDQLVPDYYAYSYGSAYYVPYTVFSAFRIYNQYYSYTDGNTASLYTSEKQFYFDLKTGVTTDGGGNTYSVSALARDGTVYVPVAFVCNQFGLSWSYIYSVGYGDVCRVKDGAVILPDSMFITAAESLMTPRYNAYMGLSSGQASTGQTGVGAEEGAQVYLSFNGLPSDAMLDALSVWNVRSTFFLTAPEARSDPARLRRMAGEGHRLGVLCYADPASEYAEASGLIFEAAHVKTVLVAAAAGYEELCKAAAAELSLVYWAVGVDGVRGGAGISVVSDVTAPLLYMPQRADVRVQCCDSTDLCIYSVLGYLVNNEYHLRRVGETENFI